MTSLFRGRYLHFGPFLRVSSLFRDVTRTVAKQPHRDAGSARRAGDCGAPQADIGAWRTGMGVPFAHRRCRCAAVWRERRDPVPPREGNHASTELWTTKMWKTDVWDADVLSVQTECTLDSIMCTLLRINPADVCFR